MKRKLYIGRLAPIIAVMAVLLAGCGGAFDPKGPVAKEQLWLISYSFIIMMLVMAVVFILLFFVLIRYRKRKGQTGVPEQIEGNHKLEIVWTVIPFLLVIALAIPTVAMTFKFAKDYRQDDNAIHVKVTAHQFWWEFEYPDLDIRTAQDLIIPTGKTIAIEMQSSDVIHSFWVPQLAGKLDTHPGDGNINVMYLEADVADTYQGKCAELCGPAHAWMNFKVVAMEEEDFAAWVDGIKAPLAVSEDAKAGEEIFAAKCLQCHAVSVEDRGIAPNLDGYANRTTLAGYKPNNEEWMRKWLQDPQALKPGNKMYIDQLEEQEITELIRYLQQLQ